MTFHTSALDSLNESDRREFWSALALRNTAGLGLLGICLLLKYFGSAYNSIQHVSQWKEAGIPLHKAEEFLKNTWRKTALPEWQAAHYLNARILLWTDALYPEQLKELPDAPAFLYAKGDTSLLKNPGVAIVGSRNSSPAALDFASLAAKELASAGLTIISGMAFGVDAKAHQAGLVYPGSTIAVLAGGIDVPSPRSHTSLYKKIATSGLLLSEFPPGQEPRTYSFPIRNRIVSGLSLGVLIVQALKIRSGSIITANFAAEQGKNLYVPAPDCIKGFYGEGTHKLLMDGVRPIFTGNDILADLLPYLKNTLHPIPLKTNISSAAMPIVPQPPSSDFYVLNTPTEKLQTNRIQLNQKEQELFSTLEQAPCFPDELLCKIQKRYPHWTAAELNATLTVMEIKKQIHRLPDSRYEVCS
jgi:DNA processing protein